MFGTRIDRPIERERANQSESTSNAIKRKTLAKEDRGISANAIISTVCSLWNTRWYEGFRKRTSSSGYASASVSLRATAETLLPCPFVIYSHLRAGVVPAIYLGRRRRSGLRRASTRRWWHLRALAKSRATGPPAVAPKTKPSVGVCGC